MEDKTIKNRKLVRERLTECQTDRFTDRLPLCPQMSERLLDVENEAMLKIVELEKQLMQTNKELDHVRVSTNSIETTPTFGRHGKRKCCVKRQVNTPISGHAEKEKNIPRNSD